MKVRVEYTTEVSDDYRRAINIFYGKPGLATREEVKRWIQAYGTSGDDDLMQDLWSARARGEEPYPNGTTHGRDVLRREDA